MKFKNLTIDIAIILVILLTMILCSGCGNPFRRYVHIHDRYPVYDIPSKAKLPKISKEKLSSLNKETRDQVIGAVKDLKSEASQLIAILETHNDYAKRKNAEYDQLFKK